MSKKLTVTILILIFALTKVLQAQVVVGLDHNPVIKQQQSTIHLKTPDEIFTPPFPDEKHYFFDDFTYFYQTIYPSPELWQDRYAFVNTTFADSLISLGIVTLDAIDDHGDIYAVDENPTKSDTLTSVKFDLSGVDGDLYFSFFLEGGGKGDAPEEADSLILEFFNGDSLRWKKVWYSNGFESHNFKQYIIYVDTTFRSDTFMFRFTNYTSLKKKSAPGGDESALSNGDMWHLDYIQLQATDSNDVKAVNDITFAELPKPSHKEYYSIPWEHIQFSNGGRTGRSVMKVRTIFPDKNNAVEFDRSAYTYNIYDGVNEGLNGLEVTSSQLPVSYETYIEEPFNCLYSYNKNQKYGDFMIRDVIDVGSNNLAQYEYNDTAILEEKFFDYYAYDDGTAEYGFGLPGNGGNYMQFAQLYKFFGNNDTLSAVDIYFSKARNNAHAGMEFSLCVWSYEKSENGKLFPSEIIYPQGNVDTWPIYTPDTNLGFNEFMRIPLEEDLIVPDTVFVGFVQFGTDFLSIGYDIGTNNIDKIRYNDGNGWVMPEKSIPAGTVMIRPVFDHKVFNAVNSISEPAHLTLYPNPARDYIHILFEDDDPVSGNYTIRIVDLLGRMVYQSNLDSESISIESFDPGLYIMNIFDNSTGKSYTRKFLKAE